MFNENKEIAKTIYMLERGKYKDKKEYLKKLYESEFNSVTIGSYEYMLDAWCWVIWKETDPEKNPEYKGESLFKVIPRYADKDRIPAMLKAQAWIYP